MLRGYANEKYLGSFPVPLFMLYTASVADLGGGGLDASFSGIQPLADPKGHPLYQFEISVFGSFSFPPPPTPHEHHFYGLTSLFTRLVLKTKYAFHGLIYLHVNFHDNRTKRTVILIIKNCRWGEKEKEPHFWPTDLKFF